MLGGRLISLKNKITSPIHIPEFDQYEINTVEWGFKHTWYLRRNQEGNIDTLLCSGDNKKGQLGQFDIKEDSKIHLREGLLKDIHENGLELFDVQVTWTNTVLHWSKGGKDVILICGDTKYGKIDPDYDSKPYKEELEWYYEKNITPIFEKEGNITSSNNLKSMNESFFLKTPSKTLYGWGWNEHGNIGTGSTKDLSQPTLITQAQKLYGNGAFTIIGC